MITFDWVYVRGAATITSLLMVYPSFFDSSVTKNTNTLLDKHLSTLYCPALQLFCWSLDQPAGTPLHASTQSHSNLVQTWPRHTRTALQVGLVLLVLPLDLVQEVEVGLVEVVYADITVFSS